ncbi:MAG: septum formation initiator family protein [Candidatus Marithrix sp.]|nr:septum formation initiator family protein [Candidatus Marithrix sp.]
MYYQIFLGILLLTSLQYNLWYGKGGYEEYAVLQQTVELQSQTNKTLKIRNAQIETEIIELKHGLITIERYAREELGMIKQGEVFYQIID